MNANPSQPNQHFDEMTCLQYLEGQLERTRALELSAHTERCGECRALLGALERESRLLTRAVREEDEPVPARLLAPVQERMPWAWIISFGMAAAGAYWLWTTMLDPWRAQLNEAGFGGTNLVTMLFFQGALWKGWGSMLNIVQGLAVLSMCAVGYFLLRRSLRRMNTIALVMGALVVALMLPGGANAAEVHKGQTSYTLPSGATVKDDLIVFGNNIRIDGTVDGDLIAFGANVTVNGHVTGDVLSAGTTLQINGIVEGSVRFGGSIVTVHGKIGKNLMAGAGTVMADSSSEIGWGATIGGGQVSLEGRIGRDVLATVGQMELDGFVGGNVKLESQDESHIGSTAQVLGKFEYKGQKQLEVASGAKLASAPVVEIVESSPDWYRRISLWHKFLWWGAGFIFGLVFLLLLPDFFSETLQSADRYGVSIGIGFLLLFGIPIAAIIACVTVVGLSVGICTFMFWIVACYAGKMCVATWIGRRLLTIGDSEKDKFGMGVMINGRWVLKASQAVGQLMLGLLIVYAIRMVPYVGLWLNILVQVWGLGAICLTMYKRFHTRGSFAAPLIESQAQA